MIPIKQLPDLDWSDQARKEILISGQSLLDETDFAWMIGRVAICGIIYKTFTSPPWFWFALAKNVTLKDLIDFRRKAELIPKGTLTAVHVNFVEGIRFAKFYGFEATEQLERSGDNLYRIFRRI